MKTAHTFALLGLALGIGFLAARWSQAEPAARTSSQKLTANDATNDDIAYEEYVSLVNYLQDTKQTNALKQLTDFLADARALQHAANVSVAVSILKGLRSGRTNQALQFLEWHLDMEIAMFGSEYNTLPASIQKQTDLRALQRARDYRARFPFTNPDPNLAEDASNTFTILDKKDSK
jgi:hypothetical protein